MQLKRYLPFLLFGGALLLWIGIYVINSVPPIISSIEPKIGMPGTILTIRGWNFGQERVRISIGGIVPTASSFIEWNSTQIRVRIPEDTPSGLVYVHNRNRRSNPALFTNKQDIPIPAKEVQEPSLPRTTPSSQNEVP